jgi:hypothetical protein
MRFRLSRHAREELVSRRIPAEMLDAVLDRPEQVVAEQGGLRAYQSKFEFERGKMFLVRAIVAEEADPPVVVTVYRTSKIAKYWRTP